MKKNVILVMCDDLGYGDVGFNGGKIINTPNLDQFAKENTILDNFYSGAPVCSPTRATCLTGRHSFRLGITHANVGTLPLEEITIQKLLRENGYSTGHFGKWHLGTLSKTIKDGRRGGPDHPEYYSPPWERDFDECFSTEIAIPLYNPMENQMFLSKYWLGEEKYEEDSLEGDDSNIVVDRAIPFIQKNAESHTPFFCVVWFHAPHEPVRASEEDRKPYIDYPENMQHYFGCVSAMDRAFGKLIDKLKILKIYDNTLICFTSDNGPEGDGSNTTTSCGSTLGMKGRKRSLFNGGINVPSVMHIPGYTKSDKTESFPASTLDYLPTILDYLNISYPSKRPVDGISLLPHFIDSSLQREKPIPLRFVETKKSMFNSPTFGLIDSNYKFLSNLGANGNETYLYKIRNDRYENYDLKSTHLEVSKKYKKYLENLLESFKNSHYGHDYDNEFSPVDEYISNSTGWIEKNRKK